MPKISVCIATYNRSQLLPLALESVFHQTETDFEILVCDDGSTDDTPALMAALTDPRVRYIRHVKNIGKSNNMRSGFMAATGDYFIKFDDDDRLLPEFLARTSQILDAHPEIDFVGTDHWVIDIDNQRDVQATDWNSQHWGRSQLAEGKIENLLEVVFVRQSLQIGATLFRRRVLQELNYMRSDMQSCEDNDLFVRLALAGKQGYYLDDRLMEYRFHAEQQEIKKAIFHLNAKIAYLENYQFESVALEQIRQARLTETKLLLGLRLINIGDVQTGRKLVWAGQSHHPLKAWVSLGLSVLPKEMRDRAFQRLRQSK